MYLNMRLGNEGNLYVLGYILPATIRFVDIAYAQLPDAMLRVRDANAMILGDDMVMYAQYGLCVHTQPGHLEAGQIVDNAGQQGVPSHGHSYIVDGPTELGIRCK